MIHKVTLELGKDVLTLEVGRMAKQANGSVFASYGGSCVLATVCASAADQELDYIPLSVDYNEKFYAAGKIPGGFLKREGRPQTREILVSRLIDRPLRPLFHKEYNHEIQLIPTTVSADQINPPDVVGMIAAAAAVHVSDIPFEGPVGAVRVSVVNDEVIINPTIEEIEDGSLEIIVAGTREGITMVEGGGLEISEELMLKAIDEAHQWIKKICDLQDELRSICGKEKATFNKEEKIFSLKDEVRNWAFDKLKEACFVIGKHKRYAAIKQVKDECFQQFEDQIPEEEIPYFKNLFEEMEAEIIRKSIFENKVRTDGRGPEDIRPITCEVDILPRAHGSALFTRGETQALAVSTLGTVDDEKIIDNIDGDMRKTFMLHYNFPPFSVGETGRLGTGRREIGHGHLAERGLTPMLPDKTEFPYTIRLVSEVLESNGSSSMATVCGGTMSLLNAGVPMKKSVAGIAMGLIKEGDDFVVLSDILGEEDHLGDMDFKVTGTRDGITAFQMDIKIDNVSAEIMAKALAQAKDGRMKILDIMNSTIAEPREALSEHAPKILVMKIDPEKIGTVIGPGGKTIRSISEKFDSSINIENDGTVTVYCKNQSGAAATKEFVESLVAEPEVGKVYQGVVKRIVDFGAFVEFMPGKEGLVHISKLARHRVQNVTDVVNDNDEIPVKLVEIDKMGRCNLSYIDAIDPDGATEENSRDSGSDRRGHRNRSDRNDRNDRNRFKRR